MASNTQANTNIVQQLYKSRQNVLNILEKVYDYDISEYTGFSMTEVDIMYNNTQLDMLLTHKKDEESGELESTQKVFIKFCVWGAFNSSAMSSILEDLYVHSDTLTKNDCLYIVSLTEPNDSLINYLNYIYTNDNYFVVVQNIKRLQFNILEHELVPDVEILSEKETEEVKKKYNVSDNKKFPEISRYDPQALAICLRPGKLCRFIRNSPTSMTSEYYRVCV